MPGFYADGEYDLAGFIVGVVERARIIDGRSIAPGDVLDRPAVRGSAHQRLLAGAARAVRRRLGLDADTFVPELGATVGDALLAPHRSYLAAVSTAARCRPGQGHGAHHRRRHHRESAAHAARRVRRGDRPEHVDRARAVSHSCSTAAASSPSEMFRAFNMGIGLIAVCSTRDAGRVISMLRIAGMPDAVLIGQIVPAERGVRYNRMP